MIEASESTRYCCCCFFIKKGLREFIDAEQRRRWQQQQQQSFDAHLFFFFFFFLGLRRLALVFILIIFWFYFSRRRWRWIQRRRRVEGKGLLNIVAPGRRRWRRWLISSNATQRAKWSPRFPLLLFTYIDARVGNDDLFFFFFWSLAPFIKLDSSTRRNWIAI